MISLSGIKVCCNTGEVRNQRPNQSFAPAKHLLIYSPHCTCKASKSESVDEKLSRVIAKMKVWAHNRGITEPECYRIKHHTAHIHMRCFVITLVGWSHTSLSQNRAFAAVGPALWNDTPSALQSVMLQGISASSLRSLKTFLFTCLSSWERLWMAFCERGYTNIHIT